MADKKKIVGSVAVDSQTGMEYYNEPKRYDHPQEPSTQMTSENAKPEPDSKSFDIHSPTPNYGESGPGLHAGKNLAGVPDEFLKLFEHDPSEVIMLQTTKHPVGLIAIYGGTILGVVLIAIVYGLMLSDQSLLDTLGLSRSAVATLGAMLSLFLASIAALIGLIAGYVYQKSRLILTNQKVVFINYRSLISRTISQLNIGEVEDVSVVQPNIIHRICKTGNLTIETAGEQFNYYFTYAQKPYDFAHKTIQAHEGTIREYGN
jgi:hypothetical protein